MKKVLFFAGIFLIFVWMGMVQSSAVIQAHLDKACYWEQNGTEQDFKYGVTNVTVKGIRFAGWIASDQAPNVLRMDIYPQGGGSSGFEGNVYATQIGTFNTNPSNRNEIIAAVPGANYAYTFDVTFDLNGWYADSDFILNRFFTVRLRATSGNSTQICEMYFGSSASADVAFTRSNNFTLSAANYSRTYNGSAVSYPTGNVTHTGNGGLSYGYYSNADCTTAISKPTNAGTYYVKVTSAQTNAYNAKSATAKITINKKAITIKANAQTITYGSSIAKEIGKVTVETLASGDSLSSIVLTASRTTAGIGTITPSKAVIQDGTTNVTTNYSITYVDGLLTINRALVNKPVAADCIYNGTTQYGVEPASGVGFSYSGVTSESRAGVYSATATLDSNHMWSDRTTDALTLVWTLAKRQVTPVLTADDRLYNGKNKTDGIIELPEKVAGDDLFASYVACTFDSSLVGEHTATATGIRLNGTAIANYELVSDTATDSANIYKANLTVYIHSNSVNTAQEALIKEATTQAGTAVNIVLPTSYTIESANGSYGSIFNESYTRSGVYYNALGVIEDMVASELVVETIPCVTVTYHVTTGQNTVYGDNTTDTSEQTTITTYTSTTDGWQTVNKARKIATDRPATATLNVYLKEGEHLLVNTAIGVYYGRMDVTVTNVNESTVLAEDKIDAFFPVNHEDDFRVSKLNEAERLEKPEDRGDYWKEVTPFTAPSTGVYTFTITVTGKSYLHSIDNRYTSNLPAQKPMIEIQKFMINGVEQHGIDIKK